MKKMKKDKINTLICILLFVLLALKSYAIPVPHGIDGHVYELDGITPAYNIDFSVEDIATGEFIQGKTRANGKYSVSLNGNDGNIIMISVWNKYNTNNRTITLQGVMHNVNLLINMTIPELPPEIISEPVTTAYVSEWYFYQVNATDPNNDELQYKLLEKPKNMHINETGFIKWKPNKNHIGNNTIIVEVSDNSLNTTQIFNITVYTNQKHSPQSRVGSGGGGGRIINLFPKEETEDTKEKQEETGKEGINKGILLERTIEKPSSTIEKITLKSKQNVKLNVKDLPERPDKITGLDKKVYTYLEIKTEGSIEKGDIGIQFKVREKWLEENQAGTADIILNRHVDNKWKRLETTYLSSKDGYAYYEAKTSGFSYFAISLNEIKEPKGFIATGPKEQYIISGIIYKNNKKTQIKRTDLKITNINNKELIETKTGIGNNPGAYYVIIKGNYGDKIDIEVKNGLTYAKTSIILTGDMKNINLILNNNGLSAITGYAFADIELNKKQSTVILIAMAMLITISGYIKIKKI